MTQLLLSNNPHQKWRLSLVGVVAIILLIFFFPTHRTVAATPKQGVWHQVRKGDTIWDIAKRYRVSAESILNANHIPSTRGLSVGKKLFIPMDSSPRKTSSTASRKATARVTSDDVSHSKPTRNKQVSQPQRVNETWHKIKAGDTLSAIAKKYNVSVSRLMRANGLTSSRLRVNQQLVIPTPYQGDPITSQRPEAVVSNSALRSTPISDKQVPRPQPASKTWHKIRPGDTLSAIAKKYNVSVSSVMRANGLTSSRLRVNQKLLIPTPHQGDSIASQRPEAVVSDNAFRSEPVSDKQVPRPQPVSETLHKIRHGDTLSAISRKYNVSVNSLMRANGLTSSKVRVNQKLLIPTPYQGDSIASQRTETVTSHNAFPSDPINDEPDLFDEQELFDEPPHKIKIGETLSEITRTYDVSVSSLMRPNLLKIPTRFSVNKILRLPSSPRTRSGFIAPMRTMVVTSGYGYRSHPIRGKWLFHQGLDLRAKSRTRIYAAKEGRVLQAGWMGGYGNLVVIEHDSDYTTWYGHLSMVHVEEGQTVRQGQVIGLSGSSGHTTGPHLHFEIRSKGESVDPSDYIPVP
jgi:murein DD-endopeptidase MepM/ murein hydrolase activator NlpD